MDTWSSLYRALKICLKCLIQKSFAILNHGQATRVRWGEDKECQMQITFSTVLWLGKGSCEEKWQWGWSKSPPFCCLPMGRQKQQWGWTKAPHSFPRQATNLLRSGEKWWQGWAMTPEPFPTCTATSLHSRVFTQPHPRFFPPSG